MIRLNGTLSTLPTKRFSSSDFLNSLEHREARGDNLEGMLDSPSAGPDRTVLQRQPIRFGIFNCNGLSGKAEILEHALIENDFDFLFLSETWTGPGRAARLSKYIHFAFEQTEKRGSRFSYGQCLMINPSRLKPEEFTMIGYDQSNDRSYQVFLVRGVLLCFVYFRPMEAADFITRKLEEIEVLCAGDYPFVLAGDLNARSIAFGDSVSNAYGTRLVAETSRLFLERSYPAGNIWTFEQDGRRSIVDHFFFNEAARSLNLFTENRDDIFLGSDHFLISAEIDSATGPVETGPSPLKPWNRAKLKDEDIKEHVLVTLDSSLDLVTIDITTCLADVSIPAQDRLDTANDLFCSWITKALEECVGRVRGDRRVAPFLTLELQAHHVIVESSFNRYRSLRHGSVEKIAAWSTFDENRMQFNRLVYERRNELFKEFGNKLLTMEVSEKTRMINAVRRSRARAKPGQLKNDDASLERYCNFFSGQYTNTRPTPSRVERGINMEGRAPLLSPFVFDRVSEVLSGLPRGKAPGPSGLINEILSVANVPCSNVLVLIFGFCFQNGIVPSNWCRAQICPIPKKGDLSLIDNYRPISLTESVRKAFELCLLPFVNGAVEPLALEQGGFRRQRGTLDQVVVLQEWIAQSVSRNLPRYMAFLDIKAAYDQVDRSILWRKCLERGMPINLLKMLQALFDKNTSSVAVRGKSSREFRINSGLLQGSPLSPILYSAFINDFVGALDRESTGGVTLGGRRFNCLLYADDIVLLANDPMSLTKLLEAAEYHSVQNRYLFSIKKCRVVASIERNRIFRLNGEKLSFARSFVYLGLPFAHDGIIWIEHVHSMFDKARQAAGVLKDIGCNGLGFDTATCLVMYRTFIRPVFEYGLALCPAVHNKLVEREANKLIRMLTSTGKTSSAFSTGLLVNLDASNSRMEILKAKFFTRVEGRGESFPVSFAKKAFEKKGSSKSCFTVLNENTFVQRYLEARRSQAELPKIRDFKEELTVANIRRYKSAYVFRNKDFHERKRFGKRFARLDRANQRVVLNWVLNRSVGRWKMCNKCLRARGDKKHLERCHLNEDEEPDLECPSRTDKLIKESKNQEELLSLVERISSLVGNF